MYPDLFELIEYGNQLNLTPTMVTNAHLLTKEVIRVLGELKVQQIGVSVDSLCRETNKKIGRFNPNANLIPDLEFYSEVLQNIAAKNINTKINICAMQANKEEDFSPLLDNAKFSRLKVFQMLPQGKHHLQSQKLTLPEFEQFCTRLEKYSPICLSEETLKNSYALLDGEGNFVSNNSDGTHTKIGNLSQKSLSTLINKSLFNEKNHQQMKGL